jgi:D-3-phosphoglycerate dehydrogenase / 2-oxoglutarate reductase
MAAAPRVLVTSRSFSTGCLDLIGELHAAGAQVVFGAPDHDLASLRSQLGQIRAWIAGAAAISQEHLSAAPHLGLIARYGVGVDAVDLAAAAERGITVTNTPGANSGAVADHTVALMLAALRQITVGDRRVRVGNWRVDRTRQLGHLTVGIVGVGRIGREVAVRLSGFGATLLGHDPYLPDSELAAAGLEPVGLVELARRSDIVTLHSPGERAVVNSAWLREAKPGMRIVNTARAVLVDEAALAGALRSGAVLAYAADDLSVERVGADASPLLEAGLADVTIFTPHSAAQTVDAVDNMGRAATDEVLGYLRGDAPDHVVSVRAPENLR